MMMTRMILMILMIMMMMYMFAYVVKDSVGGHVQVGTIALLPRLEGVGLWVGRERWRCCLLGESGTVCGEETYAVLYRLEEVAGKILEPPPPSLPPTRTIPPLLILYKGEVVAANVPRGMRTP